MEQVEQSRQLVRHALEAFEGNRNPHSRDALLDAICGFEQEVSAHVDGAYLRQLLSTARQCIQDDDDGGGLDNALMDLKSATQLGSDKPPLPALETAVADETPAVTPSY